MIKSAVIHSVLLFAVIVLSVSAVQRAIFLHEITGYATAEFDVSNCSNGILSEIIPPDLHTLENWPLDKAGTGIFSVEICNYKENELVTPLLEGFVSNYNSLSSDKMECTIMTPVVAGEFITYECEIPLYADCFGFFNLQYQSYKGGASELVERMENYPLTADEEQYCAKEPYNTQITDIIFNNNINNPIITVSLLNRFFIDKIDYSIGGTSGGCDESQYGFCEICKGTKSIEQNQESQIECLIFRGNYPYSIVQKAGLLGARIDSEGDEYGTDNQRTKQTEYSFEFINISIIKDSLTIRNHETEYYAIYSFEIVNTGDLGKQVAYSITGKKLETTRSQEYSDFIVCSGETFAPAQDITTVECTLQNKNGILYTAIPYETEVLCGETCLYNGDLVTTKAEITVTGQDAEIFRAQETAESRENLFIFPGYYELQEEEFKTPVRGEV